MPQTALVPSGIPPTWTLPPPTALPTATPPIPLLERQPSSTPLPIPTNTPVTPNPTPSDTPTPSPTGTPTPDIRPLADYAYDGVVPIEAFPRRRPHSEPCSHINATPHVLLLPVEPHAVRRAGRRGHFTYGSLFIAAAKLFEWQLPEITDQTYNTVVILSLRGHDDLGSTFLTVIESYNEDLHAHHSKLMLVGIGDRVVT